MSKKFIILIGVVAFITAGALGYFMVMNSIKSKADTSTPDFQPSQQRPSGFPSGPPPNGGPGGGQRPSGMPSGEPPQQMNKSNEVPPQEKVSPTSGLLAQNTLPSPINTPQLIPTTLPTLVPTSYSIPTPTLHISIIPTIAPISQTLPITGFDGNGMVISMIGVFLLILSLSAKFLL